jgi:GH43 family beta-xylosidase
MIMRPFLQALALCVACMSAASAQNGVNPLLTSGADPWITYDRGMYYYTHTSGNRLEIWKTKDITRLSEAVHKVVWRSPASGPNSTAIWAPELHRIGTSWFLYYTAADAEHPDDAHRHIFVLENDADDPLNGQWRDRGVLQTRYSGIDGTVFHDNGALYFAYSAYVGRDSHLILAPMENPWTLSPHQVDIAAPTFDWEKQGGRQILEGPEFLKGPDGQRFLVYSASACWSDDYSLGMLQAAPNADLLDPASWHKATQPVFKKSPRNGVFAPGHNGFFTSPDGRENWIVYHANAAPGQGCGRTRAPRIQMFGWTRDGLPDFGEPVAAGALIAPPH